MASPLRNHPAASRDAVDQGRPPEMQVGSSSCGSSSDRGSSVYLQLPDAACSRQHAAAGGPAAQGLDEYVSPAGGQRRGLEVIRERLQSRNVRLRRPSTIGIGPDDADTNPLHVLLLQRSCFSAPPQATTWSSTVPRCFS